MRRKEGARADEATRLREKAVLAMERLERCRIPRNLRRDHHEPWSSWWARVGAELPPDSAAGFGELLEEYQTLRYREPFDTVRARKWLSDAQQKNLEKRE